jgi:putative membrane protein (TIGR04086 family)
MKASRKDARWQAKDGGWVKISAVSRGLLTSLVLVVIGAVVLGLLNLRVLAVEKNLPMIATVWAAIALVAGAISGGRRAAVRGWLNGGLIGLLLVVILMLITLLIEPNGLSWTLAARNIGIGLAAGALGGTIGVNLS